MGEERKKEEKGDKEERERENKMAVEVFREKDLSDTNDSKRST